MACTCVASVTQHIDLRIADMRAEFNADPVTRRPADNRFYPVAKNGELYLMTALQVLRPTNACAGVVHVYDVALLLSDRRVKVDRKFGLIAMWTVLHGGTNSVTN